MNRAAMNPAAIASPDNLSENDSELRRKWLEAFESQKSGSNLYRSGFQYDEESIDHESREFNYHEENDGGNGGAAHLQWFDTQYQQENPREVDLQSLRLPRNSSALA